MLYRVSSVSCCLLVLSHHSPLLPQLSFHFLFMLSFDLFLFPGGGGNLDFDSSVPPEMRDGFSIRETDFPSVKGNSSRF